MVVYTGTTVAFAHAVPFDDARSGLDARYEAGTTIIVRVLRILGVPARWGKPPVSYCPGDHSVQADRKLYGLAQCARKEGVLVSGVIIVIDCDEIADVLAPVHEAIDVSFDPDSVGSVASVGDPASSDAACDALKAAFVGNVETRVEDVVDLA